VAGVPRGNPVAEKLLKRHGLAIAQKQPRLAIQLETTAAITPEHGQIVAAQQPASIRPHTNAPAGPATPSNPPPTLP